MMFVAALQNALCNNIIAKTQQFIDSDNDHPSASYYPKLDDAIKSGNQEIVKLLLDKVNCDVNECNSTGGTPLHSAVLQLCKCPTWVNIVVKMFEKKAFFGLQDNNGNTPVHLAFLNGAAAEAMDFLLELYVNPYCDESEDIDKVFNKRKVNKDGLSIYHIACTRPHLDVLKALMDHGFVEKDDRVPLRSKSPYAGYNPLHFAVASRQYEVVKFLIASGANVYVADKNGSSPLHFALQRGDSEIIEMLLPQCEAGKGMIDELGYTHFMAVCTSKETKYAEEYLQVATVKFPKLLGILIEQQVKPVATLPFAGFTPLHFAVMGGNHEVVEILLKYGADLQAQDINGTTPLHLALYIREETMIKCLLHKDDILDDIVDVFGISHFLAACASAETEVVQEFLRVAEIRLESSSESLINAKVSDDAPIYAGYTPLHFAVEFGNFDVVKFLLGRDADLLYEQDIDGSTPLHLALENGDTMMIDLFLEYDGLTQNVVNNCGLSHFMAACAGSELAIVKEYLRVSDIQSCLSSSSSSSFSSSSSSSSSSPSLVSSKTNECPHWYSGYSPIDFATYFSRLETVKFLLTFYDESQKLDLVNDRDDVEKLLQELEDYNEDFMSVDVDNICGACDFEKDIIDFNSNVMDWEDLVVAM